MIGNPVFVLPITTTFVLLLPASFSVASIPFHSSNRARGDRLRRRPNQFWSPRPSMTAYMRTTPIGATPGAVRFG
jgi:hypothetical protein